MRSLSILSLISMMVAPSTGYAATLADTMKAARNYNFEIKSQGQKVKVAETNKTEAYTKFLPTVTSQSTFSKVQNINDDYRNSGYNIPNQTTTGIQVKQSLFNGGADAYGVQKAQYELSGSKEDFRTMVNSVLFRTVQVYEDLSTKREVLKLSEENVKVYTEFLTLNQTRFELGEITATDIAQTKSRLAESVSGKETAVADVLASEAVFENLVGMKAPVDLETVHLDVNKLPKSLDAFLQLLKQKNPALLSAREQSNAAAKSVNVAYANMLPSVDASVSFNKYQAGKKNTNSSNTTYALSVSMPIFQQGAEYTGIKKSKERREDAKYNLSKVDTGMKAEAITAWNNFNIYSAILVSKKQAIEAAEKSLAGVREETKMGTRTTLDVLMEQTNLFQTQVSYRKAIQNQVMAYYSMYSLLGDLDVIK